MRHSTITSKLGTKRFVTTLTLPASDRRADSPVCMCIISQQQVFSLHKRWLSEIYAALCPGKHRGTYTAEFYISLLFHHLSFSPDLRCEARITRYERTGKHQAFLRYENFPELGLTVPNQPFRPLIERVNPRNILELLKLLLLERKVILVQREDRDIALVIEALLSLLYPLYGAKCANCSVAVSGLSLIFRI